MVANATVSATDASGKTTTGKTDGQGAYEFRGLPSGAYTVTAVAKGFGPARQQAEVVAGRTTQLNIAFEIQVEEQKVNVQDQTSAIDTNPSNSASTLVLKDKDLEALSDDPDELQSQLQALAGPAAGPNGGEIYVDGFSGAQLPPKSSIREIRINQNPFSPEYDRVGYGRIEILTKPGTDTLRGQFFLSGNASSFNSASPFVTNTPDYHSEMYRGNVGGSLSKKASYFISLDRRSANDSSIINVPALGFSQAINSPSTFTNFTPRFDYQITPNNTLTVRYQLFSQSASNGGLGGASDTPALSSQAYNSGSTSHTLQVTDNQVINSKVINETRFAFTHNSNHQTAQNTDPTVMVNGAFMGGGNSSGNSQDRQDHFELQNSTTAALGKHYVKFGGRLRANTESNTADQNFNGMFIFQSIGAYNATVQGTQAQCLAANPAQPGLCGPSLFSITTGNPLTKVTYVDTGLFATDDWRIRPKITFSYGLRYETQNDINEHHDLAPRVSLAWGLSRGANQPKTVLRVGFGVFYDRLSQSMMLQAEQLNGTHQQQVVATDPDFYADIPSLSTLANTGQAVRSAIYRIDPSLQAPYTLQNAVTLERQLTKTATLSINYLHSRGDHQFFTRNINAPFPGTYNPLNPASGVRPYGNIGDIDQYESGGLFKQNQLIANFNARAGSKFFLFGFYSLNGADSNTSGGFPSNQYDLNQDWGRASYATRNRGVVGGNFSLPYSFSVSPFVMTQSGSPYSITLGQDLNGDDQYNDRPAFATAATANPIPSACGPLDPFPTLGEKVIPINCAIGPSQFRLNLRISKAIGFGKRKEIASGQQGGPGPGGPPPGGFGGGRGPGGPPMGGMGPGGFGGMGGRPPGAGSEANYRYRLVFTASASNVLNHVNLAVPEGNLSSPYFGKSTYIVGGGFAGGSSAANRRIDLQMMFSF
jgi:hypothetical protein